MKMKAKEDTETYIVLCGENAVVDAYGEVWVEMVGVTHGERVGAFLVRIREAEGGKIISTLRKFGGLLKAIRSYRRYICLSNELKGTI